MVWALFRVVLFGGSFFIGLFFFGPTAPVHAKNETAISVSNKKHRKPFVLFLTDSPTSGARGYDRLSTPM